jgi:hypothetical protein
MGPADCGWPGQDHVIRSRSGRLNSSGYQGYLELRKLYIRLGRHLLDRSFVLNSNNILIYRYSFTSNELYFQI